VGFRAGTILVSFLLLAVTAMADTCEFMRQETIVIAGGEEWHHVYYDWVCFPDGTGGSDGGGTGPGTGPGGNPPVVKVLSASDENPNQVQLNFDYTTGGVPTSMVLEKNGVVVSSGPPATFGLYGSLDNMISNPVLTVTMCNAYGCGEDLAVVTRSTQRPRAQGAVSAQYADYILTDIFNSPPIGVRTGYESYTRILESELFYASYDVPTSGARNGRVKHVQSTDALLWENGKRTPTWTSNYEMVPSWSGTARSETGVDCYFAQNQFPNQSARCTMMSEFARDGTPGVGWILGITASGSAAADPGAAFGALELFIWP
jgi:hypothetical protein